jgi:hypothetical protein
MNTILLAFALHCSSTSYVAHISDSYTYYAYLDVAILQGGDQSMDSTAAKRRRQERRNVTHRRA